MTRVPQGFPEQLRTEVFTFDLHHRWFFVLLRHIEASLECGHRGFVDWGVRRVRDYLQVHNECEEFSMKQFGYPHLAHHQGCHRGLVAAWAEIERKTLANELTVDQIQTFVGGLWAHISEEDAGYSRYFNDNRLNLRANNVLWENELRLMA